MNRTAQLVFLLFAGLALEFVTQATSLLPATTDQQLRDSAAVFRGKVVMLKSFAGSQGLIYTRAVIQVEEVFKGELPAYVKLVHRGGTVGNGGELDDFAPQFKQGEERLLFVSRRADGTLYATRGEASALKVPPPGAVNTNPESAPGADLLLQIRARTRSRPLVGENLTDQAASAQDFTSQPEPQSPQPNGSPSSVATNLLVGSDGIPARFISPDRGESIPYLIDADYLPTGITQTQAANAVQSALAAWVNATSVHYQFAGIQSFGMASANVTNQDGFLRIQLHDHYNYIGSGSGSGDTLGVGGHAWVIQNLSPGWTIGGNVAGSDFHKVVSGFIVLASTNVFMQNITNFAEVLCHEIGHTIGLAHSSQDPNETNSYLKQAIMYYMAHGNGRGANLNGWDTNVSRQVHPPNNTPPYCYNRVLDAVTAPSAFTTPGVNTIQVRGYKLQGATLTLATTDQSLNNGSFSLTGSNLTYVPNGFYSDSGRIDPAANSFWDIVYARYSDGTNASPFATIKVVSLNSDSSSEGVPDTWRLTYFGNSDPTVGAKHHALDDADGDGYNNVEEWRLGSNPTNKASNLRITSFTPLTLQWPAKGYEVYELYSSFNLVNWTRAINPLIPTNFVPGTNLYNLTNSIGIATSFTNGVHSSFSVSRRSRDLDSFRFFF